MIPPLETYVVVSLAFAVFSAVTAIGSAIILGVGYERLRAGLERVKEGLDLVNRQTGYFATSIFKLEQRLDKDMPLSDDVPVKAKKTKLTTKRKGKKVHLADTTVVHTVQAGDISIRSPSLKPSNDSLGAWQNYQGLSREEALASFAQQENPVHKIKFM